MKRGVLLSVALGALSGFCSVDEADTSALIGNAYDGGGWISFGTDPQNGGTLFNAASDYIYSPRYAAPIRKIVMEAACSSKSEPSRKLTLTPYVRGIEAAQLTVTNAVWEGTDELTVSTFDFSSSAGVDAFRLGMTGETGNWRVTRLAVFYGTKTDDEEALLREFAQQLPVPENLTLTGLTLSSLALAASNIADAVGYAFELVKLTGCPRTELREDFVAAPNLSDGWTYGETNLVSLANYSGDTSAFVDKGAADRKSLKIEKREKKDDTVRVEIVAPEAPVGERFRECSFWCKRASGGSTDMVEVFGRSGDFGAWQSLVLTNVTTGGSVYKIAIPDERNISRIKFVFTANANTCPNCALDSLCVVYGGDEAREHVSTQTNTTPSVAWSGLASGRYACRVKALAATEGDQQVRDSAWSEEQTADLAWADIELSPPEGLAYEVAGDKLNITWRPVALADRYDVTVAPADDPENPVATLTTRSASASIPLTDLGAYVVTVTAVSPGGVSTATATLENCTVALGPVTGLEAKATAADTIAATWTAVPLAASYQAKLFKVSGTAGTKVSDYSKLSEGVWPDGWEHYSYDTETYSGNPKLKYRESWIKTETYPQPITEVKFSFKSHVSAATVVAEVEKTYIRVEGSADGETWKEIAAHQVTTAMQTVTEAVPFADGLRRIRFSVRYDGDNPNYTSINIELGKVTVSYGQYVRTELASVGTRDCAVTYRGLDRTAKYVVVVTPQPSEGTAGEAVSEIIDLASEYFRPTGPVSLRSCGGFYQEDFSSLSNMTKKTDLAKVPLACWQFFRGSGEAETMFCTSGEHGSDGSGVYCCSDAEKSPDSYMIGTLANGDLGSSFGLAFVNDTGARMVASCLTFCPVQRSVKTNPATYALEYLVTDGPWSIGTESGDWRSIALPEIAPKTGANPEATNNIGPEGLTLPLVYGAHGVQLAPGQVIIFRWRHERVASGPMMGVDDVRVEFRLADGFSLIVR